VATRIRTTWDDDGVTRSAEDAPPARSKGIHIPPEDAAFLVMLLLDVAGTLWREQRYKWATSKTMALRNIEYALGHEGGFTTMMRRSRTKRR
jgi:hypothetical protein